jgi:hypothetical protein
MRAIIFCILFAIIALVAFALIGPFFPTADPEKRAQAAFPFIVTIGGTIGCLVGMRADRLYKLRKEWLERARQNGELIEKREDPSQRTYDY